MLHSWKRGMKEITNGFLRLYFPKGSDFSMTADEKVHFMKKRLNSRPRKCLNEMTPEMVFFNLCDVAVET